MIRQLLIITIILIILYIYLYENSNDIISNKETISQEYLATGDLMFVSYDNSLGKFMKLISGSKWTHTAMIYRAPDEKIFVMETANYPNKKGVLLLPFMEWYRYNKNQEIAVMRVTKPMKFDDDKILYTFKNLSDKKLDTFGKSWFSLLKSEKYIPNYLDKKENITCYELTTHLLQEAGIAEKKLTPVSYFPSNILKGELRAEPGFRFSSLYKFEIV